MKNKITLILKVLALAAFISASAKADYSGVVKENRAIKLSKTATPIVQMVSPAVKIEPGLSEIQKKELVKQPYNVAIQASYIEEKEYSLGELRAIYREAALRYGIDWKLIESVHQVETGKSTSTCKRSYAGATGPMQFLPSTFRHYNDLNGSICDLRPSIFAAANLLAQSGAAEGDIDSALFSYNHSSSYVALVKSIMNSI